MHIVFYANGELTRSYLTPRENFLGTKLDYFKDLGLGFGDYVEVFDPDRTIPAIALSPCENA